MATQTNQKSDGIIWNDPKLSKEYGKREQFTGTFAKIMVEQSKFKDDASRLDQLVVLDQACGTGIVSASLIDALSEQERAKLNLTCADFSESMLDMTRQRAEKNKWPAKVIQADAQDTKLPGDHFTHLFFNFGPFLLPSPSGGLSEAFRLLRPSGSLGVSSWQAVPWVSTVREAFTLHPELPPFPQSDSAFLHILGPESAGWTTISGVEAALTKAGFVDLNVKVHSQSISIAGGADFVAMLPASLGLIIQKTWSDEEQKEWREKAMAWTADFIKEKFGNEEIVWEWTAIVATAKKPA